MNMDHRIIELELLSRLARRGGYLELSATAHEDLGISGVLFKDIVLLLLCESWITGAEPDMPSIYVAGQELADPRTHLWRANQHTLRQVLGGRFPCLVRVTHSGLLRAARLQEELDHARVLDATGILLDGRYIERDLRLRLAMQSDGAHVSLLMADLDNFKLVNDRLGHERGDEALRRYFSLFRDLVSALGGDTYRRGGDETVAILPGVELSAASSLANALRDGVKAELGSFSRSPGRPLSVSVGVVALGQGTEVRAALELVDKAMYSDKEAGRDPGATEAGR